MILERVVINNFQSIKEATVYLRNRGLVSVEGVTKDSDGANSNGAGKSTLINAILWCNYGDAGKKVGAVDDVVNTDAGKNCSVANHWYDEHSDTDYIITRYRKHKVCKNQLIVEMSTGADRVQLSKGTDAETQKLINEILGADKATFEADCFARQKDAPEIPAMTDTELKKLLEKVMPSENLPAMLETATKNRNKQHGSD